MRLNKVYYLYGAYWVLFWLVPIPIFSWFTNDAGILFVYYEKFALPSVIVAMIIGLVFSRGALLKDKLRAVILGIVIPAFVAIAFLASQIRLGIGGL